MLTAVPGGVAYLTGDLARKKIYPSLFALYYEGHLPEHFHIYGFARSKMSDTEFREYISGSLTCRLSAKEECGDKMDLFLQRCLYHAGQYAETSDFAALSERMAGTEKACGSRPVNTAETVQYDHENAIAVSLHLSASCGKDCTVQRQV